MISLSNRLRAIEDWIDTDVLADVGCDHGYLCCSAVLKKKTKRAYACDIAQGPLDSARETIAENHLEDVVTPILCNGLEKVPADVTQTVIAGMGGLNMISILEEAPFISKSLLLSPHKDAPRLRQWLLDHGFDIERERIVLEDGHFYPILLASRTDSDRVQPVLPEELEYGIHLEDSADARACLENRAAFWKATAEKMPAHSRESAVRKEQAARSLLARLKNE